MPAGGNRRRADEALRPPNGGSQHEGVLAGRELQVLGQLDVQRLGDGLYGLVEYLFLAGSAEDEPAEAADGRLLQDPLLQGLAFVVRQRHVTPGNSECALDAVGTNVVPPQLHLAAPFVFVEPAVEGQRLPRVEGVTVHLEQARGPVRLPHVEQSAPSERFTVHVDVLGHRSIGVGVLEIRDVPVEVTHRGDDRKRVEHRLEARLEGGLPPLSGQGSGTVSTGAPTTATGQDAHRASLGDRAGELWGRWRGETCFVWRRAARSCREGLVARDVMQGLSWRSSRDLAHGVTGSKLGCGNFHSGAIDGATAVALDVNDFSAVPMSQRHRVAGM